MAEALQRLKDNLAVITDLRGASSVLAWDQETNLPSGGVDSRAMQLATLESVIHERFTSQEIGDLIQEVKEGTNGPTLDETAASWASWAMSTAKVSMFAPCRPSTYPC